MNLWILRFIPFAGTAPVDGYFRSEERAGEVWEKAEKSRRDGAGLTFKDDFGIHVSLRSEHYAVVLTNAEASAAFNAALQTANREAQQTYGLPPDGKIRPGSSMQ